MIADGILQKATNTEIYTVRPFSKLDSGAVTMAHQMLVYRTSHSGGPPRAVGKVAKLIVELNISINKGNFSENLIYHIYLHCSSILSFKMLIKYVALRFT